MDMEVDGALVQVKLARDDLVALAARQAGQDIFFARRALVDGGLRLGRLDAPLQLGHQLARYRFGLNRLARGCASDGAQQVVSLDIGASGAVERKTGVSELSAGFFPNSVFSPSLAAEPKP